MAAPVAQEELPILEAVINIRNRLTALKRDRGEYIKPSDVNALYQAVVKQVTKLNDVRDDNTTYNNRVDTTLADVFSLLSLCYLTLGRTKECPAVYSQIASMRQILNHMNESAVYNESDLAPFHRRLHELRQIVQHDAESGKHPEAMTKLLERQFNECDAIVESLQESLSVLSVELIPIHERLVTVRRQLVALAAKEGSHKAELKPLHEELRKIDSKRVDGKFLGPGGIVPASQALCSSLLEECFDILQEIKAQEESKNVAFSLKAIYDRLSGIRAELENLVLTHRWSLRETDLWNYSLSLQEIDKMRIDGKFVDSEGNRPPGQYVLLYLLRRCYGLIYRLLSSSEPVSEELMPVANKLSTVKKCLNEVLKYGGPFSPRDLYPYQLALHQIDSMRKEGKFVGVDGSIPEGQGIVMAHLNECHELLEMLKESMDEGEEDDDEYFEDEDEYAIEE
ncbi:hypothetical protein SERLA73DRAFT_191749 [Serpula lacrymans var. lacrymans S7.3]|uniref:Uncharacterized protein n=2 Tax=Serpula lacrymans var. lacrymans TaxID=341189 RepID=F8QI76_SERL3|nr:uncharacterized protein SERLADRAFT_472763 [Serpula lacrymans var. lacrymans S7.9]EGN91978.1 hypothetical protein SERLA73DRAFT_191749 [Serpula lacrymans var. lacrymans S7.3]EGO22229.1 hypothetical protein SERLADRAFT_472763 [Serpula lacrymans var. lacrymans S7.9]